MSVCCECCVLSGRGLYFGLITCSEESTECGVSECDGEALKMRSSWPTGGLSHHGKKYIFTYIYIQYTIQLVLHIHFIQVVITCVWILRMACFLSHNEVGINSIVSYHCVRGRFNTRVHIMGNSFVWPYNTFLNKFTKLCKATVIIVMPVRLSVRLSAWNISVPTERIFMKSGISVYFEHLSRNVKFH